MFSRKDTATVFQWRIRNLPYPINNYIITVDDDSAGITIKTVNKKYVYFEYLYGIRCLYCVHDCELSHMVFQEMATDFKYYMTGIIME